MTMKYCKKCLKEYDDSWSVCLDCNCGLITISKDNEEKELQIIKVEGERRKANKIKQCSLCKNEFKEEELSRPKLNRSLLWGIGGGVYNPIEKLEITELLVCAECDKKRYAHQNKLKYGIYLAVLIPLTILFIMSFIQRILK